MIFDKILNKFNKKIINYPKKYININRLYDTFGDKLNKKQFNIIKLYNISNVRLLGPYCYAANRPEIVEYNKFSLIFPRFAVHQQYTINMLEMKCFILKSTKLVKITMNKRYIRKYKKFDIYKLLRRFSL